MPPELAADLERFRAESDERLERLQPTDTLKGLYIHRYLQLIEELGGAELKARSLDALQERRIFDFISYPYANMVRMGLVVAPALAPRFGGVDAMLREFGRLATQSYLRSLLGRAFLAGLQPSPRAILAGMPWAIRSTFSFGQRTVTFSEEGRCRFSCRREFSPAVANAGAVQVAIEEVGAKDVRVDIEAQDLFNYDLVLTWSA